MKLITLTELSSNGPIEIDADSIEALDRYEWQFGTGADDVKQVTVVLMQNKDIFNVKETVEEVQALIGSTPGLDKRLIVERLQNTKNAVTSLINDIRSIIGVSESIQNELTDLINLIEPAEPLPPVEEDPGGDK